MLKIDLSGLKTLVDKLDSQSARSALYKIPESKAILALVSQAIYDNFEKEGPGWAPLKGATIRQFVNKKVKKELSQFTDKDIEDAEAIFRQHKNLNKFINKKILVGKTRMLRKSSTTVGATNNINKNENGVLIWGTNLPYAGIHNYGDPKRNIPQREFLVIHEEWKIRIYQKVLDLTMKVFIADVLK